MRNRRYSNDDRHFWPFTLSKSGYSRWGIELDSGGGDHEGDRIGTCHLMLYLFGWVLIVELPRLIQDYVERHYPKSWDAATVERLGRDWYEERFPCRYGFTVAEGAVHVHYGPQTNDSDTDKTKVFFIPWKQLRHVRTSYYGLKGEHFWTEPERWAEQFLEVQAQKEACPKARFEFCDYDGELREVTTHIVEREWRRGAGSFKWLSWFCRPQISRTLEMKFNKETGPEKGSWKGGTVGTSIEMLPGELHESAFFRFCEKEQKERGRMFRFVYIGPLESVVA